MTRSKKPYASISLDLDNQWSYMKIHGDQGWDEYPTYLPVFVPYVLKILKELNLKITFFIVGRDAAEEVNKEYLKMIVEEGHELGNHSFNHESWLHKYSKGQLVEEISGTQDVLHAISGQKPIGFRGPGFSWSQELLEVLADLDFVYDASTLPTWIGPLARKYYFMTSGLTKEEKKERGELFGTFKDGCQPVKPYKWILRDQRELIEIPVSTIPVLKVPFHLSYLLYLSGFSKYLMDFYLSLAIRFCKMTGTEPSFLLHPLDLIGGDQVRELAFFPGMDIPSDRKKDVFQYVIHKLLQHFELINMKQFATYLNESEKIPTKIF